MLKIGYVEFDFEQFRLWNENYIPEKLEHPELEGFETFEEKKAG